MSSSAAAVTASTRGSARPTAADFFTITGPSPITPFSELPEELDEAPRKPKTTARMEIAKLRKEVRIPVRSFLARANPNTEPDVLPFDGRGDQGDRAPPQPSFRT
jgi:hypothetical protein